MLHFLKILYKNILNAKFSDQYNRLNCYLKNICELTTIKEFQDTSEILKSLIRL